MSFNFDNAVEEVIIDLRVPQRIDGEISKVTVQHVFRAPTGQEMDKFRSILQKPRGSGQSMKASRYLWNRCIEKVDGYEGLGKNWKQHFLSNDKAKSHIHSSINALIDLLEPDGDWEKN